jgi:DUF4097 and DUF4098 domain-containing protein YvlB
MPLARRTILLACSLLFLAAIGSGAERRFEKKFSVSPGGTLTLKTDVGTVKVSGTSGNEVSVEATIRGRERQVNEFEITAEQTGKGVSVEGRAHEKGGWLFHSNDGVDVEFLVKVPDQYDLDLHTSGGDLLVGDLKGKVTGETSGGDLAVANITGNVDLHTSGGDVKADRITGELRLETSGGDVRIANSSGPVEAETSGGNVTISDVDGMVRAETSGGNVTVKVKGGNKGIHAETSGGNIEIEIPKTVGATIDASTSGGSVICDIPVTVSGRIDESRVRGPVNGGGATIFAHTSGGDVRIRGRE